MTRAYYNEHDPGAAAWLRELIMAGLIADGEVDERSIVDVRRNDLAGFRQCHFFAGIGGWSYALRLAGVPDDAVVWTGSCPCQPFSSAGKGRGKDDARHLWPQFRRLIRQCRPPVVFGEQVASKAGRVWLSAVFADVEALGYRAAGADLCGPSVGAFDIRQRLWFVADTDRERCEGQRLRLQPREPRPAGVETRWSGEAGRMGNAARQRGSEFGIGNERAGQRAPQFIGAEFGAASRDGGRHRTAGVRTTDGEGSSTPGVWADVEWIPCADGKWRPTQPGLHPLATGVSGRMVVQRTHEEPGAAIQEEHWYSRTAALQGFGNAIKPQVAAAFIGAYLDTLTEVA